MKYQKHIDEAKEKRKTRRLLFGVVLSGLVAAALAVGAMIYFFAPRDKDMYILTFPDLVGLKDSDIDKYDGIEIERAWIYSNDVERGKIVSQEPYAGARRKIKKGSDRKLKIYLSLGEKTERIPDLAGVSDVSAAAALRSIGAYVKSVAIFQDSDEGDGEVVYTIPNVGSEIKKGDIVTIYVLRKRAEQPITVPDFRGLKLAEAYRYALALGLSIEDEEYIFSDAIVSAQSIPSGARVRKGSYINFRTELKKKEDEREWPPYPAESDRGEKE